MLSSILSNQSTAHCCCSKNTNHIIIWFILFYFCLKCICFKWWQHNISISKMSGLSSQFDWEMEAAQSQVSFLVLLRFKSSLTHQLAIYYKNKQNKHNSLFQSSLSQTDSILKPKNLLFCYTLSLYTNFINFIVLFQHPKLRCMRLTLRYPQVQA